MSERTTSAVADKPTPTMRDVAQLAGVSVTSVSNYLSDYPYMKQTTRERIRQAIEMLGYVTDERARSLRSGRTGLISLAIPSLTQIYFAELAERVIAAARRRGYGVTVESTAFSRRHELESVAAMARKIGPVPVLRIGARSTSRRSPKHPNSTSPRSTTRWSPGRRRPFPGRRSSSVR